MINFNVPPYLGTEIDFVRQAAECNRKICGDGPFTKQCSSWMCEKFDANKVLLTTSGTSALEMAALLCEIKPGDEVILPSFTFSSTATAFVLAGANLVFVDIRPDTMNIDETKIEAAITDKTRVIVAMHYGGVACAMNEIMDIARRHSLLVVEDAAQGVMGTYHGQALGTIGDFGCYSFHETKNYSMGEGGAIVINNPKYEERAEIIREKGTNRAQFFLGQVDKYTWVDVGSSYLPSDMNAAYLWAQLQEADKINDDRRESWYDYHQKLSVGADEGLFDVAVVPDGCVHNGHLYFLKVADQDDRSKLLSHLKANGVAATFHYIPLHSAPAGVKFGRFHGQDEFTTKESERLVRLPMYYGLSEDDRSRVVDAVLSYYGR